MLIFHCSALKAQPGVVWKYLLSLLERGRRGWLYFRANIYTRVGHTCSFPAQPRSEEDLVTSGGENKMSLKTLSWRAGLRGSDSDHSAPVSKELYSGGRRKRQKRPEDVWDAAGVSSCAGWGWGRPGPGWSRGPSSLRVFLPQKGFSVALATPLLLPMKKTMKLT